MTPTEYAASLLQKNQQMLASTLADFSDADMLVRPCPGANHAAWQLGHVCNAETNIINAVQADALPALPPDFARQFNKEAAKIDDPAAFPTKAQLMDQFNKTRAASIAWVKTLQTDDLGKPAPERVARMASSVGEVLFLLPNHVMMHIGQFQVIRRKLGKPVLF